MHLFDIWHRASRQCLGVVMGALLGLAAVSSHAQQATSKTFADGAVEITFSFEVGNDFDFQALNLNLFFDPDAMQVASPALLFVNGAPLVPDFFVFDPSPDGAGVFIAAVPGTAISGTLSLQLPFQLSGMAAVPVSFEGALAGNDDELPFAAPGFTVSAVPEPETLLLWLAGMGLLATAARRRARA